MFKVIIDERNPSTELAQFRTYVYINLFFVLMRRINFRSLSKHFRYTLYMNLNFSSVSSKTADRRNKGQFCTSWCVYFFIINDVRTLKPSIFCTA
jgi:hypothetical protein